MSVGLYSHTTRAVGTVLTAEIYNADHQKHITNHNPEMIGAFSDTTTQYQLTADPGNVGSESRPTNLAGELERIRFCLKRITGEAHWYVPPDTDLTIAAASVASIATKVAKAGDTMTGVLNLFANSKFLKESASSTEGGQFVLEKPDTSTLASDIVVDLSSQSLRVGESGGTGRGALLDFTECAGAIGSKLFHSGIAALQADMEAASSIFKPVVPAHQQHHPAHPKCWVSATGAGVIQNSYNITSVADGGVGVLTVTIATDFAYADWCCIPGLEAPTTATSSDVHRKAVSVRQGTQLAGSVSLDAHSSNGASIQLGDPSSWYMAGFGDQ